MSHECLFVFIIITIATIVFKFKCCHLQPFMQLMYSHYNGIEPLSATILEL